MTTQVISVEEAKREFQQSTSQTKNPSMKAVVSYLKDTKTPFILFDLIEDEVHTNEPNFTFSISSTMGVKCTPSCLMLVRACGTLDLQKASESKMNGEKIEKNYSKKSKFTSVLNLPNLVWYNLKSQIESVLTKDRDALVLNTIRSLQSAVNGDMIRITRKGGAVANLQITFNKICSNDCKNFCISSNMLNLGVQTTSAVKKALNFTKNIHHDATQIVPRGVLFYTNENGKLKLNPHKNIVPSQWKNYVGLLAGALKVTEQDSQQANDPGLSEILAKCREIFAVTDGIFCVNNIVQVQGLHIQCWASPFTCIEAQKMSEQTYLNVDRSSLFDALTKMISPNSSVSNISEADVDEEKEDTEVEDSDSNFSSDEEVTPPAPVVKPTPTPNQTSALINNLMHEAEVQSAIVNPPGFTPTASIKRGRPSSSEKGEKKSGEKKKKGNPVEEKTTPVVEPVPAKKKKEKKEKKVVPKPVEPESSDQSEVEAAEDIDDEMFNM